MAHRLIFTNTPKINTSLRQKFVVGSGVGSRNRSVYRALQKRASNNAYGLPCCSKRCLGGVFANNQELERLRGCVTINGIVKIYLFNGQPDFTIFDALQNNIGGGGEYNGIYISNNNALTFITGFTNLTTISNGGLLIQYNPALTDISGFTALTTIGSYLYISYNTELTTITGFTALTTIGNAIVIRYNPELTDISGFTALTTIGGGGVYNGIIIANNPSLTDISGFTALTTISGGGIYSNGIVIINNPSLTDISGFTALTTIGGGGGIYYNGIVITNNPSLTDISGCFANLQTINGDLNIQNNAATIIISGFTSLLPNSISGTVTISAATQIIIYQSTYNAILNACSSVTYNPDPPTRIPG